MNSDSAFLEEVKQILSHKGYRHTVLRGRLLELLIQRGKINLGPISVAELLVNLAETGLQPNKTSIYREIETLLKENLVKQVDLLDGQKRYELSGPHHHHLKCESCGLVQCVVIGPEIEAWMTNFCHQRNFELRRHVLEFFGLCGLCSSQKNQLI
jgi:Fur family transcriptional regulator, ferric uptake regulator